MKVLIVFAALLATAAAGSLPLIKPILESASADGSFIPEGRIINGEKATLGQFPYQAGLLLSNSKGSSWCGGSLISANWVLTAAHCTYQMNKATVYLGAVIRQKAEQVIESEFLVTHPSYNPAIISDDIALIKLITPAQLTENVQPVVLPRISGTYSNYMGDTAITSGWGKTSDFSNQVSEDLYYIFRKVDPNAKCASVYGGSVVRDTNICIGTLDGDVNKSTCNGDSGGPLVLNDAKRTQIGLTSYGAASGCDKGYPVVFTRVTSYLGWIKDVSGIFNN